MLRVYQRIGLRLYRFRLLLFACLLGFAGLTAHLIFNNPAQSQHLLLPSMVASTWLLLCLSLAYYFAHLNLDCPAGAGFLLRLRFAVRRGFSYLLALVFSALSLTLLYLSSMALRVALNG